MAFMCTSYSASAASTMGRGYSAIDFRSLLQTYFSMYEGGNPTDSMIDSYAELAYCELHKEHYTDDFAWNGIRESIRDEVKKNNANTHRHYNLDGPFLLERYDFETESYPVSEEKQLNNVSKLVLFSPRALVSICNRKSGLGVLPTIFTLAVYRPFSLTEIKMSEDNLKDVVPYMELVPEHKGSDVYRRRVYVRVKVKIVDIMNVKVLDTQLRNDNEVTFNGEIEAVEFYLDKDMSKLFHRIELGSDLLE